MSDTPPTTEELSFEVRIKHEDMHTASMAKVQEHLQSHGITFDTGMAIKQGQPVLKSWFLDWSLAGATPQTIMGLLRENKIPFEVLINTQEAEA
tara:strand:+ start:4205 stop:4486 length:282 start_codon:yes stop_codon:yes gene_type:complete